MMLEVTAPQRPKRNLPVPPERTMTALSETGVCGDGSSAAARQMFGNATEATSRARAADRRVNASRAESAMVFTRKAFGNGDSGVSSSLQGAVDGLSQMVEPMEGDSALNSNAFQA
jgi:hypothetical protein